MERNKGTGINKSIIAALCESDTEITLTDILATVKPGGPTVNEALSWVLTHCDTGLWAIDTGDSTCVGCKAPPAIASHYSVMLSRMVSDAVLESRQEATQGAYHGSANANKAQDEFARAMKRVMKDK